MLPSTNYKSSCIELISLLLQLLVAFVLISERPSMLQEVLKSHYEKDPFSKPVADMIGGWTVTFETMSMFVTIFLQVPVEKTSSQ